MKKLVQLLFCFSLIQAYAQEGTIVLDGVKSEILKKDMKYSVYLPPSYEKSQRSYPILYLLHGMGGDHTDWVNRGEVAGITNQSIKSGKSPEMIIVMPDGLIDAFYINNFDKSIQWEDFFHKEFIPAVEKKYRVFPQRQYRAIAGLSMGGYGSLYHALKYKEKFSVCYAMSAAFIEVDPIKSGETANSMFENVYIKLWGPRNNTGLHANYKIHSLHEMVRNMEEYKPPVGWGAPTVPHIMLDCGDDDFLLKANTNLVNLLNDKKIPFEFRVYDGVHNWTYWRRSLEHSLEYIGLYFRD